MITAEQRSAQARKAARIRWAMAWHTEDGRRARSAAYRQRIMRALVTGHPDWLTRGDARFIRQVLNGSRGDPRKLS